MPRVNTSVEKINVNIVACGKLRMSSYQTPRALSETVLPLAIMKANEEVSKICEQQQDAYVTCNLVL